MKKYDCNKTLDCIHELKRMCDFYKQCGEGCPLFGRGCTLQIMGQTEIDILQKWSDEHPEMSKIRKRELDFIAMFKWHEGKSIEREADGCLFVTFDDEERKYSLCNSWFSFIGNGESMTFKELLKLEVED